jgi:hypothetical protein
MFYFKLICDALTVGSCVVVGLLTWFGIISVDITHSELSGLLLFVVGILLKFELFGVSSEKDTNKERIRKIKK